MSKNKESIIKCIKKICEKYYPNLILNEIECGEKSRFDNSTSSWITDDYYIFICVKHTLEYNISDIEYFIESIMGSEVIVTEF
jgi:hypothetical protein